MIQILIIDFCYEWNTDLGAVSPGSNAPVCSNREGIYVAEEGRPLSVCFIVLNIFATTNVLPEPQTVYFATISESNLGKSVRTLLCS